MPPAEKFLGAGLYAIYYRGGYEPYAAIARDEFEWPIYVGKAAPRGGRGDLSGSRGSVAATLYARLRKHAGSIEAAKNLSLEDFQCRYLVVDDVWIPLTERLLIAHYRPLWNEVVKGFGNNPPGGKPGGGTSRGDQMKSAWDVLHPGKPSARGRKARATKAAVLKRVREHLAAHPPCGDSSPLLEGDPASVSDAELD